MRFAAVQIPAKIGTLSLNGEKLDELHFITLIFGQFAVLHARSLRFLHASICKAAGGRSFIVLFLLLGGRATLLLLFFQNKTAAVVFGSGFEDVGRNSSGEHARSPEIKRIRL